MSLLKKLAGETVIYGMGNIAGRVLNFIILTPYLTRQFVPEEYGIHATLYAYAAFLMIIFTYRMETAFFRFASQTEPKNTENNTPDSNLIIQKTANTNTFSTAALSLLTTTLVLVAALIAFAQPIANFIEYPDQKAYVIWFALIIGFDALSAIPLAKLRLDSRPIYFVISKLTGVVVNVIFIIFFLEICPSLAENGNTFAQAIYQPENRVGLVFVANLLGSAATLLLLLPMYFKTRLKFDKNLYIKMLRYALPLIAVGLAGMVNEVADRILLQRLLPGTKDFVTAQIGIYGGCYKFAILMTLFTQAFNYAAEPFFFRHANRNDAKQVYGQVAQAFTLVGCLAFLGIWFYIDIFKILVAESYHEGIKIVPILLLANVCLGLYYNFAIWYKLTDKTHIGAYIAGAGAVITIALNIALIPLIGYMGSAWATLAAYATMCVLCYLLGRRYYAIEYPIAKMLTYITIAVILYFISLPIRTQFGGGTWIVYLVNTLLLFAFFILIAFIEKKALREILSKK